MTDDGKTQPLFPINDPQELLPTAAVSTSIWGNADLLNTVASSRESTDAIVARVEELNASQYFVGVRLLNTIGENRDPLMIFDFDPRTQSVPLEENATAICGPLSRSEAIAAGYLMQTAWVAKELVEDQMNLLKPLSNLYFEALVKKFPDNIRFLPLGMITLLDNLARMFNYRSVQPELEAMGINEFNPDELAPVIGGITFYPLAEAFRDDGYTIGKKCNEAIAQIYSQFRLFVPFAGIENQPHSFDDDTIFNLGYITGMILFRKIEENFRTPEQTNQ